MAVYHGRKGRLYASSSAAGVAVPVAALNEWTLNQEVDTAEVSAFGDTNKVYVQGLKDGRGTFAGFFDDTDNTLWTAVDSTGAVRLYLYPTTDAPTVYWYGFAWMSMSITTPIGGPVAISGSWVAGSVITKKP